MPKQQTRFVCRECGYVTPRWLGRCPECTQWGTLDETVVASEAGSGREPSTRGGRSRSARARDEISAAYGEREGGAVPVTELPPESAARQATGLSELDLVLGGGLVPGSSILLAGDPGVGKSTLLLGLAGQLARRDQRVLYVTGEESSAQIRLRASRIDALDPRLLVLSETNVLAAVAAAHKHRADLVMVDSIQTMYHPDVASYPGSVAQVRECGALLVDLAKGLQASVWLIGHVTKDGTVAGPRTLEHMVDVVLYIEGDRSYPHRILRGFKNRYGPTDEIGIFEMVDGGLREVANPSQLFLGETAAGGISGEGKVAGTAVAAALEGRRVILVEVQALVVPSPWGSPRRTAMGVDLNRLSLITAVLSRRAGLSLGDKDIYVKVAGGVRLVEPGVDLAVAVAVASAELDRPVRDGLVFAGEVGLGGEVRQVARLEQRLREAAKLGFERLAARPGIAERNLPGLLGVRSMGEALGLGLTAPRQDRDLKGAGVTRTRIAKARREPTGAGGESVQS